MLVLIAYLEVKCMAVIAQKWGVRSRNCTAESRTSHRHALEIRRLSSRPAQDSNTSVKQVFISLLVEGFAFNLLKQEQKQNNLNICEAK